MSFLREIVQQHLHKCRSFPGGHGRGIVMVGGGSYLASAYIAIRHLRDHGCTMPMQLWYLGKQEIPAFVVPLAQAAGVQLVDALAAPGADDFPQLGGWECKIHAIIGCPFSQVLFLDADNIPLLDPSFMFDCEQLHRYGQIFWPDFYYPPDHQFAIRPRAWKELQLTPRPGLELESGQLLIDRAACWRELQIVRALNIDSQHSYRLLSWGDKDTFTLSWLLSGRPFCTIPLRPRHLRPQISTVLWQHWFDGTKIFQHQRKWTQSPERARRQLLDEELLKDRSLAYLQEFWKAAGDSWRPIADRKALVSKAPLPTLAQVHELARRGDLTIAESACRRLLHSKPTDAAAWHTLGLLLRDIGNFSESLSAYICAVELAPDVVLIRFDLAKAYCSVNRAAQAIPHLVEALQLKGSSAHLQSALGVVLEQLDRFPEAAGAYRNALQSHPTSRSAHYNLARALRKASEPLQSINVLQRSLKLKEDDATAYEGIIAAAEDMGEIQLAIKSLRKLTELDPANAAQRSWLLYNLHYDPLMNRQTLYQEHVRWGQLFARHADEPVGQRAENHSRIRVGYVSPDFRQHTVPRFIAAALTHHDRNRFEIFCYSDVHDDDAATLHLRALVEHWRDIVGLDDERAHQIIADDQIDILVDLRGHAARNRLTLFARRAAPIQINMVGYFDTTGLSTMDYRLTDDHQDPLGISEHYHTEQLLRLGRSCWCYMADPDAPPVALLPAQQNGYVTFGSLNKILKINDQCANLWASVLATIPRSKLLLAVGSKAAGDAVSAKLQAAGIDAEQILLRKTTATRRQYLARFDQIDIALDTFPFNGITTTCDSLWMGVPAVSMAGETTVSRAGKSILTAAGLPQLSANDARGFVNAASQLAGDIASLARLRWHMRQQLLNSTLMDHVGFTVALEDAYDRIWHEYIKSGTGKNTPRHTAHAAHPI